MLNFKVEDYLLYEDQGILVCRKPAGLPVQSARMGMMDLESALKNYLARKTGKLPFLGVVHRLDQPVEGVLVFGKTPKATADLNRQMGNGNMKKWYLAVIEGRMEPKQGRLEDYLVRDGRSNCSRVAVKGTAQAKKSLLDYEILEEKDDYSLVRILLHTGRHHQIRVQFSSRGCPLVGDQKYGQQKTAAPLQKNVALCAYRLSFQSPANSKPLEFQIIPEGAAFEGFLSIQS